eukprot:CAMPEP_0116009532 /NCGR_PEP_ID=MMETSP0321-20121206/3485_1 /TAXON_ID=163516 /ORGANISM="Leptocylindrus danicus var. danicus, Strain B650" /LENGTH=142 /DNA_ID=CAMNT_0003478505 /DNA_START=40 /DNA_END=468 /DNA_ORIENTATION=+
MEVGPIPSISVSDDISGFKIKPLSEMCVNVVVRNFGEKPFDPTTVVNARVAKSITHQIQSLNQIDPLVAAKYIRGGCYWERACADLGLSCKRGKTATRIYFENYLTKEIEHYNETKDDAEAFLKMVEIIQNQIFTLKFPNQV